MGVFLGPKIRKIPNVNNPKITQLSQPQAFPGLNVHTPSLSLWEPRVRERWQGLGTVKSFFSEAFRQSLGSVSLSLNLLHQITTVFLKAGLLPASSDQIFLSSGTMTMAVFSQNHNPLCLNQAPEISCQHSVMERIWTLKSHRVGILALPLIKCVALNMLFSIWESQFPPCKTGAMILTRENILTNVPSIMLIT